MNRILRIISTLLLGIIIVQDAKAQSFYTNSGSEIVMTKEELKSFLEKIADIKRRQISSKRNNLNANNVTSNLTLQREFDLIHRRLDMLMMNRNTQPFNSGTTTTILPASPNMGIDDDNENVKAMQDKISKLNEEIRVLKALSDNSDDKAYDDDIARLEAELKILRENKSTTQVVIQPENAILKGFKDYKYTINFANNSTKISNNHITELERVAKIAKEHEKRVTVVIRGFASNKGSAMYNNELSFNRTEAIKRILINNGLDAKNILTLHHGIDYSHKEADARRAEISLLVH